VVIVVVGLAAVLLAPAHARESASRVVDRTFSCEAGFVGGLHQVTVSSGFSASPGSSKLRASSVVTKNIHEAALGSMSSDGVVVHRRLCSVARSPVKLTTKGLRGGAVPSLGVDATCETPRRVLLRVRAVFKRPVTPQTVNHFGFPQYSAMGEVETATLAVGTRTGKTIAYLGVTGAEKARLFTLRTCKED
jgi:hypothetical protein